jgi:putative flippase GtrA
VSFVRGLYERFRQLIHEAAKFGVIGVIGLLVTNVGYGLLHSSLGIGPVTATTIATIVAMIVTYVGNRYWSFRHRERTNVAREGVIFFVLNGIGLLIQDAVVAFNYYILGYGHNKAAEFIALNVGIALATLFRFWSYRKWVWHAPAPPAGDAAEGGGQPPAGSPPVTTPPPTGRRRPPVAGRPPWEELPSEDGNGQAPDLAHANGRRAQGQAARTGPSPFGGPGS